MGDIYTDVRTKPIFSPIETQQRSDLIYTFFWAAFQKQLYDLVFLYWFQNTTHPNTNVYITRIVAMFKCK